MSRGVKEGLLWVLGRNRKLLPCRGKQQQRPLAGSALSGFGDLLGAEEGREACWCVPVVLEGEAPQKGYFGNVWDDFGLCQRWEAVLKQGCILHDFHVGEKAVYFLNLILFMCRVNLCVYGFNSRCESLRRVRLIVTP